MNEQSSKPLAAKAKFDKVNKLFDKIAKENAEELEHGWITPINDVFPYSKNGIWAFIATMGSGKSYNYVKIIAQQEEIFDEPFFEQAVICSTSSDFDMTVKTYKQAIKKTELTPVKDSELLDWLGEYVKKVKLYNALMQFVNSDFKKPCEVMSKLIQAKGLQSKKRLIEFVSKTLADIGWKTYQHRCLLILDDFASHPMLKNKSTPLSMLLKKLRHFHINVVICVQTTKSIPLDIKRILSDCVLFPGISYNDFKDLFKDSSLGFVDADRLWNEYIKISDQRTMIKIHVKARRIIITPPLP